MSWTMVSDLLFTRYQANKVLDNTDFHNDAEIVGNPLVHQKYVSLQHPDDQLVIAVRDDSLQRFTCLRVEALIRPTLSGRRLNIVEGWMSFAFFVEADQRLFGGIFDGQDWVPVQSGNNLVPLNQWSRVSFEYDGICLGRLKLNGASVGTNVSMPLGMRQPQQNITLGHWPSGDGRYTFVGDLGHVRISRRDYEDFLRDAWALLFCQRRLLPHQAEALKKFILMAKLLDERTKEALRRCALDRSEELLKLLRTFWADNQREIILQEKLAADLRQAWCCTYDPYRATHILQEYLKRHAGAPGTRRRAAFQQAVNRFSQLSAMCAFPGDRFDRLRQLLAAASPELSSLQEELEQLFQEL